MKIYCLMFLIFISKYSNCQHVCLIDSGTNVSCRGLSVWNNQLFWVCGNNGNVGYSYDGGATMHWQKVKGFEDKEFRDIHVFSPAEIIIMAINNPATILKSTDSGTTWHTVFEYNKEGMFLDAMDFKGKKGYCIGDPIDGKFFILQTTDKGNHWSMMNNTPLADSGEACFASSGSNIAITKKGFVFVSGGLHSHLYKYDGKVFTKDTTNFSTGRATSGANAIYVDRKKYYIVGGDFTTVKDTNNTFYYSTNNGKSFTKMNRIGYQSSITKTKHKNYIACGTNGVFYNAGDLRKWKSISPLSFHVVKKAKHGNAIYFAGGRGKIGKLILD